MKRYLVLASLAAMFFMFSCSGETATSKEEKAEQDKVDSNTQKSGFGALDSIIEAEKKNQNEGENKTVAPNNGVPSKNNPPSTAPQMNPEKNAGVSEKHQ